ncbi:MAG: YHYH protein [Rhodobacteraceae bacterium]|nr:YHYH protein [Paracoccaceae bacterium]
MTRNVQTSEVSLAGIPFRPGTAEYYGPSGRNGFSRDRSSGWRVEGMGGLLRMDPQNAHVDERGMYHYHAVPSALAEQGGATLTRYTADGFEIHYAYDRAQSSWQLKSGKRASGPGGAHDGTYEEDYEYVAGSGSLDECNGAMVNGQYMYFATDTYPFFPRCFKGTVSSGFIGRGREGGRPDGRHGPPPPRRG